MNFGKPFLSQLVQQPAGWVLLICLLSFAPPSIKAPLHSYAALHLWGHVYLVLALGFCCLQGADTPLRQCAQTALVLLFLFSVEWAQARGLWTKMDWPDLLLDCVGLCLAWLGARLQTLASPTRSVTSEASHMI